MSLNCMNDSKDFQDVESVRSGNSHVTSQQVSLPPHPNPGGMLSCSIGIPSRREGPPSILDAHGMSGNVFQLRLLQNLIRRNSMHGFLKYHNQFTHHRRGRTTTTANFRSSFQQIPTPATFACWKIRFKTEVCIFSQNLTEAMQWIKEEEMVDSVDDLRSSSSVRGIRMPDSEVLDERITSALNQIIHKTRFKKKVSLEEQKAQKQDRFLHGREISYLICEYFRVGQ